MPERSVAENIYIGRYPLKKLLGVIPVVDHDKMYKDTEKLLKKVRMNFDPKQRLGDLSGAAVARKRQKFSELAASLDAMSPLKVLGRGYAMAQNEAGQILKSHRDVTAGERVSVTLGEGGFTCTVDKPFGKEKSK